MPRSTEDPGPVSGPQDALDLEVDGDVLADRDAAGHAGDRAVERYAEVHAVDVADRGEAHAGAAVRVGTETADLKVEGDGLGDALQRQVALEHEALLGRLDAGGDEGHRRVLLHLEEVGAADVSVALLLAGVDRGQVNRGRDTRGEG